jgi:hypothetical protein
MLSLPAVIALPRPAIRTLEPKLATIVRRPNQAEKRAVFALKQNHVRVLAFAIQRVCFTHRVDLLTIIALTVPANAT